MNSNFRNYYVLAFALTLLVAFVSVSVGKPEEQHPEELLDDPWTQEVPCRGKPEREGRGSIGDREFRVCFKFDEKLLQPGSEGSPPNPSDLYVTSYTKKGQHNLTNIDLVRVYPEDYPGLIIGTAGPIGSERGAGPLSSVMEFKIPIQITSQSRSGRYPIAMTITSGTDVGKQRIDFTLPVLNPENASVSVQKKPQAFIDCWAGSECSALELEVRNRLPYKLTISNISISSEDLLQNKPSANFDRDIDANSKPRDLNLVMQAKPITFRRVFSGFGRPKATVRIDFEDQYGRPLSTENIADLEVRPNVLIIAIFLILGAVIGTFIRIDLGRLQRAGIINRRERLVFAATTFASGIIICLIALFANIKLIVSTDQNSYSAWDPKVLFLTALVTTVTGLPILYAYLKLPRQEQPPSPPANGTDKAHTNI